MTSDESKRTDPAMQTKRSKRHMVKAVLIRCSPGVPSPWGGKSMKDGNLPPWCSCTMRTPVAQVVLFSFFCFNFFPSERGKVEPS